MARVAIDHGDAVEVPVTSLPELEDPPAEGGGTAVRIPAASLPEFADIVEFAAAGSSVSGEFWCADCGYGVVVPSVLPPCPMCRGNVWERREPRLAG